MLKYMMVVFMFVILMSCGETAQGIQTQHVDDITISLESLITSEVNVRQEWIITVATVDGQLINDADVYLDLDMPAMPMGDNMPIATSLGEGKYQASGTYTMNGEWHIDVHVGIAGDDHVATFIVVVP